MFTNIKNRFSFSDLLQASGPSVDAAPTLNVSRPSRGSYVSLDGLAHEVRRKKDRMEHFAELTGAAANEYLESTKALAAALKSADLGIDATTIDHPIIADLRALDMLPDLGRTIEDIRDHSDDDIPTTQPASGD